MILDVLYVPIELSEEDIELIQPMVETTMKQFVPSEMNYIYKEILNIS